MPWIQMLRGLLRLGARYFVCTCTCTLSAEAGSSAHGSDCRILRASLSRARNNGPTFRFPHATGNINGIGASPCRHCTSHNTCLDHQIPMQAARVSTSSWWPSLLSCSWKQRSALLFVHRAPTTLIGPRFSTPRQLSTMAANTSKSEDRIVAALGQYTT
jgi:hypothetical protein